MCYAVGVDESGRMEDWYEVEEMKTCYNHILDQIKRKATIQEPKVQNDTKVRHFK